jgi:hypothetical protein
MMAENRIRIEYPLIPFDKRYDRDSSFCNNLLNADWAKITNMNANEMAIRFMSRDSVRNCESVVFSSPSLHGCPLLLPFPQISLW